MNQKLLGILRAIGYPMLFGAFTALVTALPGINGLPTWLPAGLLTMALGAAEHTLAVKLGYNLAAGQ
jgi:hypothetical protein